MMVLVIIMVVVLGSQRGHGEIVPAPRGIMLIRSQLLMLRQLRYYIQSMVMAVLVIILMALLEGL